MMLYKKPISIELIEDKLIVEGNENEHSERKFSDMVDVLMEAKAVHSEDDFIVYHMYRNIIFSDTIRYDITYMPSAMLGEEFAKTYGHFHPEAEKKLTYPEIYQILEGEATYLLQKRNRDESVDVVEVNAVKGDVVLIPPGYGHVTINRFEKGLVMANLVCNRFESDYSEYKKNQGAAYYYTKEGKVQNQNYVVREFKVSDPKEINREHGLLMDDLLEEFYKDNEKFKFLEKPSLLFG